MCIPPFLRPMSDIPVLIILTYFNRISAPTTPAQGTVFISRATVAAKPQRSSSSSARGRGFCLLPPEQRSQQSLGARAAVHRAGCSCPLPPEQRLERSLGARAAGHRAGCSCQLPPEQCLSISTGSLCVHPAFLRPLSDVHVMTISVCINLFPASTPPTQGTIFISVAAISFFITSAMLLIASLHHLIHRRC